MKNQNTKNDKKQNPYTGYKSKSDERIGKQRFVSSGEGMTIVYPDGHVKKT